MTQQTNVTLLIRYCCGHWCAVPSTGLPGDDQLVRGFRESRPCPDCLNKQLYRSTLNMRKQLEDHPNSPCVFIPENEDN